MGFRTATTPPLLNWCLGRTNQCCCRYGTERAENPRKHPTPACQVAQHYLPLSQAASYSYRLMTGQRQAQRAANGQRLKACGGEQWYGLLQTMTGQPQARQAVNKACSTPSKWAVPRCRHPSRLDVASVCLPIFSTEREECSILHVVYQKQVGTLAHWGHPLATCPKRLGKRCMHTGSRLVQASKGPELEDAAPSWKVARPMITRTASTDGIGGD